MQRVLFHSTVFGPIHSRRLGTSLGINLTPDDGKICSFDCLYCEAGFNAQGPGTSGLPSADTVRALLEQRLSEMSARGDALDVITFSGNGEPTIHPQFGEIIDATLRLRDKYYPEVKVSVLTNSTMLHSPAVVDALHRVDNSIMKLDSALTPSIRLLDRPGNPEFTADYVIGQLADFGHDAIVQTMICRGDGFDNTTDAEIEALIEAYRRINPRQIMLYSIARPTPDTSLKRVSPEELRSIADRIAAATGITVQTA